MRSIIALALLGLGCSSLGAYPSCGDVYRLRPEEFGRVFCSMAARPGSSERAMQQALRDNADRNIIRDAILDADRAIEQGNNP